MLHPCGEINARLEGKKSEIEYYVAGTQTRPGEGGERGHARPGGGNVALHQGGVGIESLRKQPVGRGKQMRGKIGGGGAGAAWHGWQRRVMEMLDGWRTVTVTWGANGGEGKPK